ncbi:unnamed protein product [Plutella xylostella]|uniref:(diamondback moth) hypothetical protein n=1 Tax=Plutella xylostella TaxID=51655 RepID=A0A8S4GA26_PLUXY|nr:unnamed protein product [Plutella xylostella]
MDKDNLQLNIKMSLEVIRAYEWLLDLFVLDFFVDDHWNKLPPSWQRSFQDMDPADLGKLLVGLPTKHMLPLSFIALLNTVKALTIPRQTLSNSYENNPNIDDTTEFNCGNHPRLKNLFLKHVKLKKRHEISVMADVVNAVATRTHCRSVIDFGSGLGHLVRVLAYKYDIYAAGIECQSQLTDEARKLDKELEYTAKKHLSEDAISKLKQPVHLNVRLSTEDQLHHLVLPETMTNYGLIGLHPCGDLGPLLLKHFVKNPHVKFICVVGCCFMKLTNEGYPMSEYVKTLDNHLSYTMTEISCHAIEVYCERLIKGQYEDLKIHAFRAALERVLVGLDPKLHHAPVRSIKHSKNMDFKGYCQMALQRLNIPVPSSHEVLSQAERDLAQWRRVVAVYTLRLALAPLVETVVLYDRVLYVLEHGLSCDIRAVFDPKLSPRNHVIVGER